MLNDGQNVEFGKGHTGEGDNRFAQFFMSDALRTVGIDLVEHLCDVQVIQCIKQRPKGIFSVFDVVHIVVVFELFVAHFSDGIL